MGNSPTITGPFAFIHRGTKLLHKKRQLRAVHLFAGLLRNTAPLLIFHVWEHVGNSFFGLFHDLSECSVARLVNIDHAQT